MRKVAGIVQDSTPGAGKVKVQIENVDRGEIRTSLVRIQTDDKQEGRKATVVKNLVEKSLSKIGPSEWAKNFALSTIDTLVEAESHVHGHSASETILHELGSVDTLIDILGTASLVDELGLSGASWVALPLAVGGGTTRFSNRSYPNPPPAVLEIVRKNKFPFFGGNEKTELTTPTGAAITVNLARSFAESYPMIIASKVGYGAGSKELTETANILRLSVGESMSSLHTHDQMVMLETNLDDVTGEVIGHTVERLLSEGARDVTVTPVYMKKNRPGNRLTVIADEKSSERLARLLMVETGTLGVREIPIRRHISNREETVRTVKVQGKQFRVRVKKAFDAKGNLVREKPEYEDLRRVAEETGLSLREISQQVERGENGK